MLDLLTDMTEQSLPRTETGSLLGDLEANAPLVQSTGDTAASRSRRPLQRSPPRGAVDIVIVEPLRGLGDLLGVCLAARDAAEQP